MRNFYKPSGKFSCLYFVYLFLSMVLIVPIFSFIQAAFLWYSPFVVFSLAVAVVCVFSVALLCGHWCVTKGKVRNKKVAVVSALLIGMLFTYLSVLFYCAFYENRIYPRSMAELLAALSTLTKTVENVLDTGIAIFRRHSLTPIRLGGGLLAIVWAAGYLLTQIIILLHFLIQTSKPFLEQRRQWAKGIELEFSYIEDKTIFISKMRAGDLYYISSLPAHRDVNVNYSSFELYPMEDNYCLSVCNHLAKEPDKNGQMKFEKDTLFEYLIIGKQAGDILFTKQINCDRERVKAKIASKRTKRRAGLSLLRDGLITGLFIFSAVMAYRTGQLAQVDLSQPSILFGAASFAVFFSTLRDWQLYQGRRHRIGRRSI